MEEQTSFFGVKGLFYYKRCYGLGYDAAPSNESTLGYMNQWTDTRTTLFLTQAFLYSEIGRYGGLSQPLQLDNQLYTIQRTFNKITPFTPTRKVSSLKAKPYQEEGKDTWIENLALEVSPQWEESSSYLS